MYETRTYDDCVMDRCEIVEACRKANVDLLSFTPVAGGPYLYSVVQVFGNEDQLNAFETVCGATLQL